MALKEEFINIVQLLIEPYEYCELITDCKVKICKISNEINNTDYMSGMCCDCERKLSDCFLEFSADVGIEDFDNGQNWYINFHKNKGKGYITHLRNRKQMFEFLREFKNEIELLDRYEINYNKICKKLSKYANGFLKELINKYFVNLSPEILPIKFHEGIATTDNYSNETKISGEVKYLLKQNSINIYCVAERSIEDLKKTIRHELIHYCLNMSGYVSDDNTSIFHAFCKIYDAGAYVDMLLEEQLKYDEWKKCNQTLDKIILEQKHLKTNIDIQTLQILKDKNILGLGNQGDTLNTFKNIFENMQHINKSYKLLLENASAVAQKYVSIESQESA